MDTVIDEIYIDVDVDTDIDEIYIDADVDTDIGGDTLSHNIG